MQFGFILALIISLLISIFAIQNGDLVTIDLFFGRYEVSQAIIILVSVFIGAIIAAILGSIKQIKSFTVTKELKTKVKQFETEISDMHKSLAGYESDLQIIGDEKNSLRQELSELKEEYNKKIEEMKEVQSTAVLIEAQNNNAYLEEDEKSQAESQ